ncbi:MAG: tetratricopeptide repeat protein [Bacteroidota bacterium]|nr:tetratricopeptide repeat protein [Bacteroidota bacterium]
MKTNMEIIDKYLNGEMNDQELKRFEHLLSSDVEVQEELELHQAIGDAIMEDDIMSFRDTMQMIYAEDKKVKRQPAGFSRKKLFYAAATIALLLAIGGIVKQLTQPDYDNHQIFDKFYQPYEVTVTYRSGNTETDRMLLNALQKYEDGNYEQALVLFEQLLEKRKDDMSINLYSGISYMEVAKYQKATQSFQTIITDNNNLFIEQAEWYLAMCYLKTEDNKKAKELLDELIKKESYYKEMAEKIKDELYQ